MENDKVKLMEISEYSVEALVDALQMIESCKNDADSMSVSIEEFTVSLYTKDREEDEIYPLRAVKIEIGQK